MKKFQFIYISLLITAFPSWLSAQTPESPREGELSRQVEVQREYTPAVSKALKLPIRPDATDTVALRPELNYNITPTTWTTPFGVTAISPVRLTASRDKLPFAYFKTGGGYPGRSLLDAYVTSTGNRKGFVGASLNHYGRYSSLENDLGNDLRATESGNRFNMFGKADFKRTSLWVQAGYDYDVVSRYGSFIIPEFTTDPGRVVSPMQHYSMPHVELKFGNDFTHLDKFNFEVGADFFHLSDRYDAKENSFGIGAGLGKKFGIHKTLLRARFENRKGGGVHDYYSSSVFTVTPGYGIETGKLEVAANVGLAFDNRWEGGNKFYFLPTFDLSFDITNGYFVPFVELESRLVVNDYRGLTRRNPYMVNQRSVLHFSLVNPTTSEFPVLPTNNSRDYQLRVGFSGSVGSWFSYKVFGGAGITKDYIFFANTMQRVGQENGFMPFSEKRLNTYVGGLELNGQITGNFEVMLAGRFYGYSQKDYDHSYDKANMELDLYVKYMTANKKFRIQAGMNLIGKRWFAEHLEMYTISGNAVNEFKYFISDKLDPVVNLNLETEYLVYKNFGVFVLGENLLNQKLYPYAHYRGNGIGISAGIKASF